MSKPKPHIPVEATQLLPYKEWGRVARLEWSVEDWKDYYHGISFALFKIARRHDKKPAELDYQI